MVQSPRVFAQTQVPELVRPDPSHERDQEQKGSQQNGSIKESLEVRIREKVEVLETGRDLARPE